MKLEKDKLYLCFHKPKGFVGHMISLWTLGIYCHCEFVYNDDVYLANPPKVMKKKYTYDPQYHDLYEVSSRVDAEKVMEFFNMTEGMEYDMKGIGEGQAFYWMNNHAEDKYFCSEWAMNALDYALGYIFRFKGKTVPESDGKAFYYKFNPARLYKYLLKEDIILNEVK